MSPDAEPNPAVDLCIEMLAEFSVHIRRMAVWELGSLGDHRATPHLLRMLEDPDWELRHYTVMALGRLGDASGVEVLRALLASDWLSPTFAGPGGPAPEVLAEHLRQDLEYAIAWAAGQQELHEP